MQCVLVAALTAATSGIWTIESLSLQATYSAAVAGLSTGEIVAVSSGFNTPCKLFVQGGTLNIKRYTSSRCVSRIKGPSVVFVFAFPYYSRGIEQGFVVAKDMGSGDFRGITLSKDGVPITQEYFLSRRGHADAVFSFKTPEGNTALAYYWGSRLKIRFFSPEGLPHRESIFLTRQNMQSPSAALVTEGSTQQILVAFAENNNILMHTLTVDGNLIQTEPITLVSSDSRHSYSRAAVTSHPKGFFIIYCGYNGAAYMLSGRLFSSENHSTIQSFNEFATVGKCSYSYSVSSYDESVAVTWSHGTDVGAKFFHLKESNNYSGETKTVYVVTDSDVLPRISFVGGTDSAIVAWGSTSGGDSGVVQYFPNSSHPTAMPTFQPTSVPTFQPTAVPRRQPTAVPTFQPTAVPTFQPTTVPTLQPTAVPTFQPTAVPTLQPTLAPNKTGYSPDTSPTVIPSLSPHMLESSSSPLIPILIISIGVFCVITLLALFGCYRIRRIESNIMSGNTHYSEMTATLSESTPAGSRESTMRIQGRNWTTTKKIGRGAYGDVYEVLMNDGETAAVKIIDNPERDTIADIKKEFQLVKSLDHPNVIQYFGTEHLGSDNFCILMEYLPEGSLSSLIARSGRELSLQVTKRYTRDIVSGLSYLHLSRILHRDIKGANVLISKGVCKLTDFGCIKTIDTFCAAANTVVGTPRWMAPEVIQSGEIGYGVKADVWSVGCTICEMLTGQPPWPVLATTWELLYQIANSNPVLPTTCDDSTLAFLKKLLHADPSERPTANSILSSSWINSSDIHVLS